MLKDNLLNNRAKNAKHLGFFDAENYILNNIRI